MTDANLKADLACGAQAEPPLNPYSAAPLFPAASQTPEKNAQEGSFEARLGISPSDPEIGLYRSEIGQSGDVSDGSSLVESVEEYIEAVDELLEAHSEALVERRAYAFALRDIADLTRSPGVHKPWELLARVNAIAMGAFGLKRDGAG